MHRPRTQTPPLRWNQHLHLMKTTSYLPFLQVTHVHPGQLSCLGPLRNLLKNLKGLMKLFSTMDHHYGVFLLKPWNSGVGLRMMIGMEGGFRNTLGMDCTLATHSIRRRIAYRRRNWDGDGVHVLVVDWWSVLLVFQFVITVNFLLIFFQHYTFFSHNFLTRHKTRRTKCNTLYKVNQPIGLQTRSTTSPKTL